MKKLSIILSVLLLSVLTLIGIGQLLVPDTDFSNQERRPLAQAPAFSLKNWFEGNVASNTEKWLADQFTGRSDFLALKAQTQKTIGHTDNGRVYFADDDYLMEIHEKLDEEKLKRNIGDLISFKENFWKEESDGKVTLFLTPTAAGVYSDKLPNPAVEADQATILATLREQAVAGGLETPDLLTPLRASALPHLYFRTDHHWTQDGAHEAFRAWSGTTTEAFQREVISESFYGTTYAKANLWTIEPEELAAYTNPALAKVRLIDKNGELVREGIYNPEALNSIDPYEYFVGENRDWLRIETGNSSGGHLILFKDSYANALVPFLIPQYESITLIDLRYLNEGMEEILDTGEYTEAMFVYNVVTLADENSTFKLLR